MNGNYPIRKGKCDEEQKQGLPRFMSYRPPSPLLPPFAFRPWCFSFAPKCTILPTLRNTALDTSTSSDTDNDRDASSTCLSDSFFAVCWHNQSDEDPAMSIKYRGVPFRFARTNCRCKRFYAGRTYATFNSLRYCSSF